MTRLSEYAASRDNNFNLIRLLAAYAVLLSHSYPIALGANAAEPIRDITGITLGSIAVDIFFVTSGYLVVKSLIDRKRLLAFIWARVLRIYPGLVAAVTFSTLGLWALFSRQFFVDFFLDSATLSYFLKNVTLLKGVEYTLPGIFHGNPYKDAVNGSLWTLPYEVRMYLLLALFWILVWPLKKWRQQAFCLLVVLVAATNTIEHFHDHFTLPSGAGEGTRFRALFFTGSALYLLRNHITVSARTAMFLLLAILFAMADKRVFFCIYYALLPLTVILFAYSPTWLGRRVNRAGDYSYGIYIYAFPVQQTLAAMLPGISVLEMMIAASLAVGILAVASWHLVEKKALGFKIS